MEKKKLFEEMQAHLLNDDAPSAYFYSICDSGKLDEYPFSMLSRLKKVPQSQKHHPEGNVWNHTMMVIDEAARKKGKSGNPAAFMWAALLHDIGKAETTSSDRGRITAYDHDKAGARLAEAFLKECLNGSDSAEKQIRLITALVRWHMQILFVIRSMPFADVKSMLKDVDMEEIALLGYCDRIGRLNANGQAESENMKSFIEKCHAYFA